MVRNVVFIDRSNHHGAQAGGGIGTIVGSGRLVPKSAWQICPAASKVSVGLPSTPSTPKHVIDYRELLIHEVRNFTIDLSFAVGGLGGEQTDAVAARGFEGVSECGRTRSEG